MISNISSELVTEEIKNPKTKKLLRKDRREGILDNLGVEHNSALASLKDLSENQANFKQVCSGRKIGRAPWSVWKL